MSNFLFDKIISVKLYKNKEGTEEGTLNLDKDPSTVISIDIRKSGLKQDIELEVSELPGMGCHDCTLRIRNFMYMPSLREYAYMEITAGYGYGDYTSKSKTVTFSIAIFTAYQETPNPDGVTVFQGLTVGQIVGLLTSHRVTLNTYEDISIKDFITKAAMGASGVSDDGTTTSPSSKDDAGVLHVNNYLPDELNNIMIKKGQKIDSPNGLSFLSGVYKTLYPLLQSMGYTYVQQVYNGTLSVGVLEVGVKLKSSDRVTDIKYVYNASFIAYMLDIAAPWDPECQPGSLVRISPNYFVGQQAPNSLGNLMTPAQPAGQLSPEEIKSGTGIYRILTMKVKFATCRDTNRMELRLIPVSYLEEDPMQELAKNTYEKFKQMVKDEQDSSPTSIIVGKVKDIEDVKKVWEGKLKGNYSYETMNMDYGITFSDLAKQKYGTTEYYKKLRSEYSGQYVVDIDSSGNLIFGKYSSLINGIVAYKCTAWPIIVKATYAKYKEGNESYHVDINDPDTLPEGTTVDIPVLPDNPDDAIAELAKDKELFKAMGDYYIANIKGGRKPWAVGTAKEMYNMYLLLGGTL